MTQEIENPMLLPEPTYTREAHSVSQPDLTAHQQRVDDWNERQARKSREAAKDNGQARTA